MGELFGLEEQWEQIPSCPKASHRDGRLCVFCVRGKLEVRRKQAKTVELGRGAYREVDLVPKVSPCAGCLKEEE